MKSPVLFFANPFRHVRSILLCGCFALLAFTTSLHAQVSAYGFSQSSGTYTPISGGTVLGTPTNDDNNFTNLPIGFNFVYNGNTYTAFSVNANGYIRMGTTVSSSYSAIAGGTNPNVVCALNYDLQGNTTTGDLEYITLGSAPNRTLVVQWTSYRAFAATGENMNFQIRLNETTNTIDVVYGNFTVVNSRTPQVGIDGTTNADFNIRQSTGSWNATTAGVVNSANCALSSALFPASGLTFTWTPPVVCSGSPTAGTTVANPSSVCPNGTTALSLSGSSVATGLTYQWLSSANNINWTVIPGATNSTYNSTPIAAPVYFRCVVTCTNSALSDSSVSAFVTVNTPVYAAFPYMQTFDNTWMNGCSTHDRPDNSWNNTPNTGNSSWRRQDDGASAGWSSTFGIVTPQAPSTGAADFHTYNSTSGSVGALDLYIDMSTASGNSELKFDYMNVSGNDSLSIETSTDGGMTFSAPLANYHVAAAWANEVINLGALNSATTVIRFRAVSDFGSNDIGVDNVHVLTVPTVDVGATAFIAPTQKSCFSNNEFVSVQIKNFNITTLDFSVDPVTVHASATGPNPTTFPPITLNSGTLPPGGTQSIIMSSTYDMTAGGLYNFTAYTSSVPADGDNTNDTTHVAIGVGNITSIPHTEDFETTHYGWTIAQVAGTGNWAFLTGSMTFPTLAPHSGNVMVYFNSFSFGSGTDSRLASPCINFTGVMHPSVDFYMSQDNGYSFDDDRVELHVSTDGGITWSPVLFTAHRYNAATPGMWTKFSVCLDSYANMANVEVAFDGISQFGDNIGLDDITFYDSPPAIAGTPSSSSLSLCSGDSATLTLSGYTGMIQWQSSPDNFTWTNLAGDTSASFNTGGLTSSIYYHAVVTGTGACPASATSASLHVVVHPYPVVSLGPDITICGSSVALNAQNPGATYAWNTGATTQVINANVTGIYSVNVSSFGCSSSDTISVTVNPVPLVYLGPDITQCGDSVMLDAGNAGASFMWNDNSTMETLTADSSGTYFVTVTNAAGCTASDTINITIKAVPDVVITAPSDTACLNDPAFALTGGFPAGGVWNGAGVNGSNFDPIMSGTGTHVITYTYVAPDGCPGSATMTITVDACTGIALNDNSGSVSVFPNPAQDMFNLVIATSSPQDILIELFSPEGKLVYTDRQNVTGTFTTQIPLNDLADGIYLLRLSGKSGVPTMIKILKQQ